MRFTRSFAALAMTAASLAVAACGSSADAPADQPSGVATPTPTPMPTAIPVAFQGRFGLVPEDCTDTSGAAKGLVEVSADQLKFYESVGKLQEITQATEGRIRGTFAFSGEGQEWTRDEVLDLRDEGKVLVRREFGENASPEPFDYTRCE